MPGKISKTIVLFSIAATVGFLAYFVALFSSVGYTGAEMLVCQPFMAVGFTAIAILGAMILGFPMNLLRRKFRRLNSPIINVVILAIGFLLYIVALSNNPDHPIMDFTTASLLFIAGYFFLIFPIIAWPQ